MTEDRLWKNLDREIGMELEPARPLLPAWRRSLFIIPVWALSAVAVLTIFGVRSDFSAIGPVTLSGVLLFQIIASYLLLFGGSQMILPASSPSLAGTVVPVLIAGLSFHVTAFILFQLSPIAPPAGESVRLILVCLGLTLVLGFVPLGVSILLSRKGLPLQPLKTGLAMGLGCGVSAEAAWRLHCHINSFDHIFIAHLGAVSVVTVLGVVIAFLWARVR